MLNPDPATTTLTAGVTETLIAASDEDTWQQAITMREPDHQVAWQDLAWWVGLQERLEIRADLRAHGLL